MAVNKDFRVKNGLIVGDGAGNISAGVGSFTVSLSTTSLTADNLYGNVQDVTYSELSITGGLSSDGLHLTNAVGDIGLGTLDAVSATATIGQQVTLFTIPVSKYRSGKAVIQAVSPTDSFAEVTEFIYVQYGSEVKWTEYATVGIGATSQVAQLSARIYNDNVEISALNWTGNTITILGSISQLYAIT
jgi:hypothetical protein